MDLEQLKLILEALKGVSQDAGSLFTLWLWLKFGSSVLSNMVLVVCVVAVVYAVYRAVMSASGASESETFIREMRDRLRTGSPGMLTQGERIATLMRLREIVAEAMKK